MSILIDRTKHPLPCVHAHHFNDWVPMPFGVGNTAMPGFECMYEGDKSIEEPCTESTSCPAYEPVPTSICPIHDEEYVTGFECGSCMVEQEAAQDAWMEQKLAEQDVLLEEAAREEFLNQQYEGD